MTSVTIDATPAASAHATGVNSISLTTLTVGAGNFLLALVAFGRSPHTGYSATWDAGGTNQNMGFIVTADNGAAAPAIAIHGLQNPTPGNKTLTVTWTGATDDVVLYAISFSNVNLHGGLSGSVVAVVFNSSTSNAAAITMPAIQGGIQVVTAAGLVSAGTPSGWAAGPTSLYVDSTDPTWGAGAYQTADASHTFTQNISASELWAIAGVVVNPANVQFPPAPIVVNPGNSISSGLALAIPCLGKVTLTDLLSTHTAIPTAGTSTDTSGGYGGGLNFPSGTTDIADFGVWQPFTGGDHTILALCNPASAGGTGVICGQCDTSAVSAIFLEANVNFSSVANAGFMAYEVLDSGGTRHGADDEGGPPASPPGGMHVHYIDGGYHTFAGRNSGGTPTLWTDGANVTRNTGAVSGTFTSGSQHFSVGNLPLGITTIIANCTVVLVLGWNRALTDAEMAAITANPFQVLETQPPPSPSAPSKVKELVIWWKP